MRRRRRIAELEFKLGDLERRRRALRLALDAHHQQELERGDRYVGDHCPACKVVVDIEALIAELRSPPPPRITLKPDSGWWWRL